MSGMRKNGKIKKNGTKRVKQNGNNRSIGSQQYLMESNISRFPKATKCVVGRNSGPFPDEYFNTMKADVNQTHAGAVQVAATYKINAPFLLFGPQANWAGAYAANYPAGASWLLGSRIITGSAAPYFNFTILYYRFELEFINSTAAAVDILVFPSINPSYIGMTASNLAEERGAIKLVLPASSIGGPYRCRLQGRVSELFGVKDYEVVNDGDYSSSQGADPTRICYMHVVCLSKDGTTSISTACTITAYFDIKFSGLNPMGTTGPALLKSVDDSDLSIPGLVRSSASDKDVIINENTVLLQTNKNSVEANTLKTSGWLFSS